MVKSIFSFGFDRCFLIFKAKNFSSCAPFKTTPVVLKSLVTNSNSIPGTRTIIYLRNCLNESEGNPENSENEQNSNNDGEFQKLNEIFSNSEDGKNTEYRDDKVFQEKLMKPDSTQNSLKNFPDFSKCLKIFILYWIKDKTSTKFTFFVAGEFDIFRRYTIFFIDSLAPRSISKRKCAQTRRAERNFTRNLTAEMKNIKQRQRNSNVSSEAEILLSMGRAYIQLFVKAFFIVKIWERKLGTPLRVIYSSSSEDEDDLDQLLDQLLTSPNPTQIIRPDEFRATDLIQFIDILFRFDEHLDGDF